MAFLLKLAFFFTGHSSVYVCSGTWAWVYVGLHSLATSLAEFTYGPFLCVAREKCLLPLQLALESKNVKLAQHALAGIQVPYTIHPVLTPTG